MPLARGGVQGEPAHDSFPDMNSTAARIRRWWKRAPTRRRVGYFFAGSFVVSLSIILAAWYTACAGSACPAISRLNEFDPIQASKVYAADGRRITDYGTERRTVKTLLEMSPAIPAAFLAVEDKRFYEHHGVDWIRFFGAIKNNILSGGMNEGFSTITMQLAGNLFPGEIDRRRRGIGGIPRKIREARFATEIEKRYSKDRILELYLNQISLGSRAFGVEEASQRYFGKSSEQVNVAEAAMLAALPKAPERYNPRKSPRAAVTRRNVVIDLLHDDGALTAEEADTWKAYPLTLSARPDNSTLGEYFVEYVRIQLGKRFGGDLYSKGLRIYTTLDLDAQAAAERAMEEQLQRIERDEYGKFPHKSYADYLESGQRGVEGTGNRSPYLQGAAVVMEATTGNIIAMVGGRDFGDSKYNRAVQAERQPGSTFKPIVYAAALEQGMTLGDYEVDSPVSIPISGQPNWEPGNYSGRFSGATMTMREAIWQSTNSVAVRVGLRAGVSNIVQMARRFGITTPLPRVPAITLGAASVHPLELIAGYSTFANLGTRVVPNAILRVEDSDGHILWEPEVEKVQVLSDAVAWSLNSALRGVVTNGTASSSVYRAGFQIPSGGKTGTTNDYRDVWYVGFTSDLVAGVWIGFDRPEKIMPNAQGGKLAAPAFTTMMLEIYQRRKAPPAWPEPEQVMVPVEIDRTTGFKATPFCPEDVRETRYFAPGSEPKEFCPLHSPFRPGGEP